MEPTEHELFRRSIAEATAQHTGAALDVALTEVGWSDALAVEPRLAVSTLFELQGWSTASSAALDQVVGRALGGVPTTATTVVLPPLDRWHPPGDLRPDGLAVRGLGGAALATAAHALVVAVDAARDGALVAVVVPTADLDLRPVQGLDPTSALVEVQATVTVVEPPLEVGPSWASIAAHGQLALAHELVGASRRMLELARTHALERIQFGRPIATFQAVRHRLAESLVAIEMADAVVVEAWEDGDAVTAAMAKALAGRSARTVARHSQQILAGIGFTTEHPLHRSIRRVLVLDRLFGSSRALTHALGAELLATRQLPAPLPL